MQPAPRNSEAILTPWLDMASHGAVIVTSNQRAARYLLQQHTALARARGLAGWATPRILTWDAWLSGLWKDVALADDSAPVLISAAQENELWRDAVRSFDAATSWNEIALATLAQQAWALLQQYADGLPALGRYPVYFPDWQQFQKWATKFAADNRRAGWLPHAQLARELEARFSRSQWQPPPTLIAWGFDEFTPAQTRLLHAIRESSQIQIVAPSSLASAASGQAAACENQREEVRHVAAWVSEQLAADPNARLAILTTKAGEDRGLIYRTFTSEPAVADFNFSLGFPLSHAPLVQTALAVLRWTWQPLPPQQVSALLLSPSLHRSDESLLRLAEFDCDDFLKRNATDLSVTLEQFVRWLLRNPAKGAGSAIADLLSRAQNALRIKPRRETDSASAWAEHFRKILSAFQLPSPLASSSADFQTWERWELLLDDFASLSFNGATFSAQQALERLQKIADETIFQPESTATNVEILGPLEAAGSLFDGIFFLGCTEDRWPIPVSPNPLLSLDLQQACAMPGAVRGANIASAKKMTERLLHSAPEVNFSFPMHGPEGELRPATVLAALNIASFARSAERNSPPLESRLVAAADLDPLPWQFGRRHLSTAALRSQAACPFQAFANQRLRTQEMREPEDGLDPLQRGNLLHKLLHEIWLDTSQLPGLRTSEKLRELIAAGTLASFVEDRAKGLTQSQQSSGWEQEFLLAERERITALVSRWLTEIEAQRAPFEVVEGEAKREIAIENLVQLSVRLDRLDKLVTEQSPEPSQLEYVLIDYKTGNVDLKDWQPPRLDEPQLPIYADYAVPAQPVAVAFAGVRTGKEMCFQGVTSKSNVLPQVEPGRKPFDTISFSGLLENWNADIVNLAQKFADGEARVSPKHGAETCKFCGLQSLCRVAETGALLRDETDTEPND